MIRVRLMCWRIEKVWVMMGKVGVKNGFGGEFG